MGKLVNVEKGKKGFQPTVKKPVVPNPKAEIKQVLVALKDPTLTEKQQESILDAYRKTGTLIPDTTWEERLPERESFVAHAWDEGVQLKKQYMLVYITLGPNGEQKNIDVKFYDKNKKRELTSDVKSYDNAHSKQGMVKVFGTYDLAKDKKEEVMKTLMK